MQPDAVLPSCGLQLADEWAVQWLGMFTCGAHIECTDMPQIWKYHELGSLGSLTDQTDSTRYAFIDRFTRRAIELNQTHW